MFQISEIKIFHVPLSTMFQGQEFAELSLLPPHTSNFYANSYLFILLLDLYLIKPKTL